MANLARRGDLFSDLFDVRKDINELFSRFFTNTPWSGEGVASMPLVEAWIDKDQKTYHVRAELPGIDPKDVQLNVQGNTLTIHAERKQSQENKEANYLHREFSYGYFDRVLLLPEGTEADKVNAEYNNGVLEVTAPVSAAALPRKVEIKTMGAKAKAAGA